MLNIRKYLSNQTIYGQFYFPCHAEPYCNHRTRQGGKIMDSHTEVKLTQNQRFIIIAKLVLLVSVTLKSRFVT